MKIGKVRGVELYLRPYVLLAFLLALFMGSLETVLLAYAALTVHEAGHVVAARLMHMRVDRIELAPYGGVAHIDEAFELLPAREMGIALAGPAVSFLLCLLTLGLSSVFTMDEVLVETFVKASFILGIQPAAALPLDGGRMLRAALTPAGARGPPRALAQAAAFCWAASCCFSRFSRRFGENSLLRRRWRACAFFRPR
jgi:stage IV sporulation protein FB